MKKLIIFDLDQTIYNNDTNEVPKQTALLLETLSKKPDVTLGLATGRSKSMLHMIAPYDKLFSYFVMINGGIVFHKETLLFDEPILHEDLMVLIDDANKKDIILGMIGNADESITFLDDRISYSHTGLQGFAPKVDPKLYEKENIYQLWLIGRTQEAMVSFTKAHPKFQLYLWRKGGGDFIYKHINKGDSIQKLRSRIHFDYVIAIGDGDNDFQMLEQADLSIAMGNARSEALKKKADLIAPHINDDQLYDFFLKHNLI
jgi:peptidyl-prolyl cis-trans isomerase B (cyclophilin B)